MLVKPKKLLWGRYGKLYIVRYEPEVSKKRNAHYYLCECKCGVRKIILGSSLEKKKVRNCGCVKRERKQAKMVGRKFGRWTVIRYDEQMAKKEKRDYYLVRCDCNSEKVVAGRNLRGERSKSCGCLQREEVKKYHEKQSSKIEGIEIDPTYYMDGSDKVRQKFYNFIRKRDKRKCQRCKKTQKQELADIGRRLSVHHKNGNHWDDRPENCIAYCNSCHQTIERAIERVKYDARLNEIMEEMKQGKHNLGG
jgi:hypothetical protein